MNGNYCTLTFTETFRKWSLDIQAGKYFAWKTLLSAIFLCLPLFSGCNAEETAKVPPGSKKILIAVFSYTGNTRRVAEAIQRKTGGTLIEIEPETPYSKDYQAVVKQGKEEVDSGFLPKLKTKAANIRDYDVIFVGSPIWWYTIAPPVASFLHDHDLSGKTVVPFFTHGGYGIGHSLKDIRKYAPGAVQAGEFELDRNSLKEMDARITKWLKEIGVSQMTGNKQTSQIRTTDSIQDIVNHPAFRNFGRRLLPWDDDRNYDIPLDQVATLLPYHSNVKPAEAAASLNRLIGDANAGKTVFYDIYTEQEKTAVPAKRNTGLFFYRGKPGAPFAVVNPGGGFAYVGSFHEGFPYAAEISRKGYNAFVLKYRTGSGQYAVEDLAAALKFIFQNADELGVGTKHYSLWGSSAGARMAAFIGSSGLFPKPAAVVMAYTGQSEFTRNDPPTFSVVGSEDRIASPATVEHRAQEMKRAGIDVEFRLYRNVGHGFGSGRGTGAEGWIGEAVKFWEKHIL